jgi:hypothetical protein
LTAQWRHAENRCSWRAGDTPEVGLRTDTGLERLLPL